MPRRSWRFRSTSLGLASPCSSPRRRAGKQPRTQRQHALSHPLQRAGAAGTSVFNFADLALLGQGQAGVTVLQPLCPAATWGQLFRLRSSYLLDPSLSSALPSS